VPHAEYDNLLPAAAAAEAWMRILIFIVLDAGARSRAAIVVAEAGCGR